MSNDVYNTDLLTKEEKFWLDRLSTDLEMSSFVNFNKKVGVKIRKKNYLHIDCQKTYHIKLVK